MDGTVLIVRLDVGSADTIGPWMNAAATPGMA